MPAAGPSIEACLIVRDEHATLPTCLESLRGIVDEVVVCDTGSSDGTVALAMAAGATVVQRAWPDHFAEARNTALESCSADWVLSIDADEIVVTPAADTLRAALQSVGAAIDALVVEVVHADGPDAHGLAAHLEAKVFRRDTVVWAGRVHERLVRSDGRPLSLASVPNDAFRLLHSGYDDAAAVQVKSARNARLCEIELDELRSVGASVLQLAEATLDLGRSYLGCGRTDEASTAFESVRSSVPNGHARLWATEFLVRLRLAAEQSDDALRLADDLLAGGGNANYCNWFRALALTQRGDLDDAREIVMTLTDLADINGNPLDMAQVRTLREFLREHRSDRG